MKQEILSLETQKSIAFAALRNYANSLRQVHSYDGLRELRNMLKGFSGTLLTSKKHRKQKKLSQSTINN